MAAGRQRAKLTFWYVSAKKKFWNQQIEKKKSSNKQSNRANSRRPTNTRSTFTSATAAMTVDMAYLPCTTSAVNTLVGCYQTHLTDCIVWTCHLNRQAAHPAWSISYKHGHLSPNRNIIATGIYELQQRCQQTPHRLWFSSVSGKTSIERAEWMWVCDSPGHLTETRPGWLFSDNILPKVFRSVIELRPSTVCATPQPCEINWTQDPRAHLVITTYCFFVMS